MSKTRTRTKDDDEAGTIGLRHLFEHSPHVDAIAAIEGVAALTDPPDVIVIENCDGAALLREQAEATLLALPKAPRLHRASAALLAAFEADEADAEAIAEDIGHALAVVPMNRALSRRALIDGAGLAIRAPRPIFAATLRSIVLAERTMPTLAELIAAVDREKAEAARLLDVIETASVARAAAVEVLAGCLGNTEFAVATGDLSPDFAARLAGDPDSIPF